jgi:glycine betaine/proline transport system permease protein
MAAQSPVLTATRTPIQIKKWAGVVAVIAGVWLLSLILPALANPFPKDWYLGLRPAIDQFQSWVISNRGTSAVFLYFFDPISAAIDAGVRAAESVLLTPHWAIIIGVNALLAYWLGGWRLLLLAAVSLFLCGLLGLWQQSMQTLALMTFSVLLALLIGIPLGILCAMNDRFERIIRPLLDIMQTMPAFVYLIPVVLFFGVARVPAVVATVIYAIPPVIRLTNLGIREVQPAAVEAATAFGSTRGQILRKVQIPLALPAIMAGVNQVIMMALGIVVIAAMVGAGGLGREVYLSLQRLQVGAAFEAGLAIVILAIMLDRVSEAMAKIDFTRDPAQVANASFIKRNRFLIGTISITVVTALCVFVFQDSFPSEWRLPLRDPIDEMVRWLRDNLYVITGPLSDFLTLYVLNPFRDLLQNVLPWSVVIVIVTAVAAIVGGYRLAFSSAVSMFMLGLLGLWSESMDTFSQVLITTLITVVLAIPIGILSSQSDRFKGVLRPALDFLQTVPTFVYLVPAIMLFNIGRVPGLIASVLYAIPVGIKLADMGIRQVPTESVEAAKSFGSTRAQTIMKVQLPLARTSIALSINQMIMMVLAMVIIAGLVGGAGLGLEAVIGLARSETGRGIEAGLAIVLLAMILDRITQAWAKRQD